VNDYSSEDPTPRKKSRARERVERRRQTHAHPSATTPIRPIPLVRRPRVRQVIPAGIQSFSLEDLPLNTIRLVVILAGAAALMIGIVVVLGLFKDDEAVLGQNAIWIGTEWTYQDHSPEAMANFAQKLRDHQIGSVYAWVSWLKEDGQWAGTRSGTNEFAEMEASVMLFVRQFKAAYPESRLYGWIGVPTENASIPYRLGDPTLQETIATFSDYLVQTLGFDGVFLNVEPVWNHYSEDFLALLGTVRRTIGDDALISVAIPPDWTPINANIPKPAQVAPGTEWDKAFKQRVSFLVDELAIMAYNSGLTSPFDYIEWMAYQVESYAIALDEVDSGAQIMIGIPTYDNELPGHNTAVENVSSALSGVRLGLERSAGAANQVQGVAIYAGWAMDDTEWLQFKEGWIKP
jgi:hypothetical protein